MPINPNIKLADNILDLRALEQKSIREGFGLVAAGEKDERVAFS